jgi:hypothetical protein
MDAWQLLGIHLALHKIQGQIDENFYAFSPKLRRYVATSSWVT